MHKAFGFLLYLSLRLTIFPFSDAAQDGGVPPQQLWCVAKNNAEDSALQAALDWACGAGGADCSPIQKGGPCYDPSNIQNTASYAFNDYFLKHGMDDESCSFDNTAAITSLDPSHDGCKFPSSLTVSNGNFTGSTPSFGMGPSYDLNGCSEVACKWFWPSIASHFLLMISLVFAW